MTWTSALLAVGPAVLFAYALRQRDPRQRASLRMLGVIFAVAYAAPLLFTVLWRLDATRVAIELHAIAFRTSGTEPIRKEIRERRQGNGRIVIGDLSSRRERARQARFGTLVFLPRSARGEKGSLRIELPPVQQRAGLIAVQSQGVLGAETLQDNDNLCIAGRCWTYDEADRSFTLGKLVARIPPRQAEIPGLGWTFTLPFATPATAATRTWSVDFLGRQSGAIAADRHVRSFLAYTKPGPRLRLFSLDPDIFVQRAGARTESETSFTVDDGDGIAFYTLPPESSAFAAPGIAERRSVVYRAGERSLVLALDTPEVHSLTVAELNALALTQEKGVKKKVVALSMGDAQLVDKSLYFAGLSDSVAVEASSLFELSRFFPRDFQSVFRIISARGPFDSALGRIRWVGASDLAAVRLDVFRPPLLLLLFGVVLLLLKIVAAFSARFTTSQALMAGAIELLVGVRLLIGYRVWSMPPHRLEAVELAIVAWMALPWIFLAASVPVTRDSRKLLGDASPAFAALLLSTVFTARVMGGRGWKWVVVWLVCHLLAVGAALVRSEEVRSRLIALKTAARARTSRLAAAMRARIVPLLAWFVADTPLMRIVHGALAAVVVWFLMRKAVGPLTIVLFAAIAFVAGFFARRILAWSRRFSDPEMTPIVIAALLFTIVRVGLLFFGFKESANLGVRVSLSVLHIPAAAMLEGFYFWRVWRRVQANGRLVAPDLAAAMAILVFVWGIPAALASDIGLALLNVPLFVLLLRTANRHAMNSGRILTRALVAVVILFIAGAPLLRLVLPFVSNEEFLLSAASDSNYARFLHFAAPEKLQDLATKRGESLAITSAILQSYIRSGFFGYGYGHTEVSSHLGDTALRDFAPAVFVAAEWGLIGTVAMLLIYLLFAMVATPWLPWSAMGSAERPGPAVAFVAAATITVSSIYMILANHELLLLTGKNAYLLGLDSAGDVIETIALLLLVAYGSTVVRDDESRSFGGSL